jgi:hypothetical protein
LFEEFESLLDFEFTLFVGKVVEQLFESVIECFLVKVSALFCVHKEQILN